MSRSDELSRRIRRVESRNICGDGPPIYLEKARGSEVWDVDGMRYIDFSSGFGVAAIGHSHPRVVAAAARQAGKLTHAMGDVYPAESKIPLLEKLAALFGRDAKVILGLNGSDAVESALKTAVMATGRPGVVAFEGAYHGLGYGAMALTHRAHFREPFLDQIGIPVRFAPFPLTEEDLERSLGVVERHLAGGETGAVIVEPIQGRAGIRVPPNGFLRSLERLARDHGALFVLDEVMTGFGRTGWTFAHHAEGVSPDIIAVGKSLGGGFPLSAAIGRAEIMDSWPACAGEAIHTSTFLGHPVACAAALETIAIMEEENLPRRSREMGEYIRDRLGRGCRGRGLMLGLPLAGADRARKIASEALRSGLIVLVDGDEQNVVEIIPPLTIEKEILDEGLAILEDALGVA